MVYVTRVLYIGIYIRMTVHDGRGRSNVKIDIGPSGEAFWTDESNVLNTLTVRQT